ncbi:MAG TPA: class I SAM-dependent methyltransferase [Flavobacteriales bacterium]|nr:class I SAM-dependent methyltransferase [Flavobacteriales bacterium]
MSKEAEEALVAEAFSRQAPGFDVSEEGNAIIVRMRDLVRRAFMQQANLGDTLLELNAGTGIDSFYFARRGLKVLATDAAPGMVAQLNAKRAAWPELQVEVQQCSFLELHQLGERRFHHVFSNFGGLNCTDRLDIALKGIDSVLEPGGTCTLVIMPRFSPWEVLALLKGHFKLAFRRFKRNGTQAHLEGVYFTCWYYSPRYVRKHLGAHYDVLEQRALSLFVPPPHAEGFPKRWPKLFNFLHRMEERFAHRWPFKNWGDHFVIVLRKGK